MVLVALVEAVAQAPVNADNSSSRVDSSVSAGTGSLGDRRILQVACWVGI